MYAVVCVIAVTGWLVLDFLKDRVLTVVAGRLDVDVSAAKLETVGSFGMLQDNDTWICDTGATGHSTSNNIGARNAREAVSVSLGNAGQAIKAQSVIDIAGQFVNNDGTSGIRGTLKDVSYHPEFNFNLLSLTKLLTDGWEIRTGNGERIVVVNKVGDVINFDLKIPTARGMLLACRFIRDVEIGAASTSTGLKLNIHKAHRLLGHRSEASTRAIAAMLGWTITREHWVRANSVLGKGKTEEYKQESRRVSGKVTVPGELVHLDLSKVTVHEDDGSEFDLNHKHWKILVDAATGKKWSHFTTTKSGMVEPTCEWLNKCKTRGLNVKAIRLDPAGENKKLEREHSWWNGNHYSRWIFSLRLGTLHSITVMQRLVSLI
eukprot:g56.t1 g56   contig1:128372-129499(+)